MPAGPCSVQRPLVGNRAGARYSGDGELLCCILSWWSWVVEPKWKLTWSGGGQWNQWSYTHVNPSRYRLLIQHDQSFVWLCSDWLIDSSHCSTQSTWFTPFEKGARKYFTRNMSWIFQVKREWNVEIHSSQSSSVRLLLPRTGLHLAYTLLR